MRWLAAVLVLAAAAAGIATIRHLRRPRYDQARYGNDGWTSTYGDGVNNDDDTNPLCYIPYGVSDFATRSGGKNCYRLSWGSATSPLELLKDLGHPENASILASFESNHRRGFSFINLPESTLPVLASVKTSDVVTSNDLIGFGMAVQESVQDELTRMGRADWIAVATGGQYRTTDYMQESQTLRMSQLPLVHIDYTSNATLHTVLNELGGLKRQFQYRLATSPTFQRLDKAFGNGNVENAGEFMELAHTINVWAPSVDVVTSSPLSMMSVETLCDGQARECKIAFGCENVSNPLTSQLVVCPTPGNRNNSWFWKPRMAFGQAFVFDSRRTPHSSVPVGKGSRRSVEVRVIVVRPKEGFDLQSHRSLPKQMRARRRRHRPCWTTHMVQAARETVLGQRFDQVRTDLSVGDDTILLEGALDLLRAQGFSHRCPDPNKK
ncbi:Uncharacterized protein PBTT_01706 [Plasmodiophora brassicae]